MTDRDAYGQPFVFATPECETRQADGSETARAFRQRAEEDAAEFKRWVETVAEHFGITVEQVNATWSVAHQAWQALAYEAHQRKVEAARRLP